MNYYRILLKQDSEEDSRAWRGLTLLKDKAAFVETKEDLDIHDLFERGIAAKQLDSLPETDMHGDVQPVQLDR